MPFHVVGLKCVHCGSYNTCLDSEPTDAETAVEESAVVTQAHGDDDRSSASATVPHEGTGDGSDMNME